MGPDTLQAQMEERGTLQQTQCVPPLLTWELAADLVKSMDAQTKSPIIAVPSIKEGLAAYPVEENAYQYENFAPAPFFKTEVASNEADEDGSKYGLFMTTPAVPTNSTTHETGPSVHAHDQFTPDNLGRTALTLDELIESTRTHSGKLVFVLEVATW